MSGLLTDLHRRGGEDGVDGGGTEDGMVGWGFIAKTTRKTCHKQRNVLSVRQPRRLSESAPVRSLVRPLVSGELFGSSYRRSRSRHLSTLSYHQKTTNLEPDLMTHFSRPSLLPSLALLLQMTRQTATAAAAVAVNCDASTDREKELTD